MSGWVCILLYMCDNLIVPFLKSTIKLFYSNITNKNYGSVWGKSLR
jgi:hypothetical protein